MERAKITTQAALELEKQEKLSPNLNTSEEEEEIEGNDSAPSRKKIRQERHEVEKELGKDRMIDELRWTQYKADRAAKEKITAQRLKILDDGISRLSKSKDGKRLDRLRVWRKKLVAANVTTAVQNKATEKSFVEASITEATESAFLNSLLVQ